jgi:hypothetical protein
LPGAAGLLLVGLVWLVAYGWDYVHPTQQDLDDACADNDACFTAVAGIRSRADSQIFDLQFAAWSAAHPDAKPRLTWWK